MEVYTTSSRRLSRSQGRSTGHGLTSMSYSHVGRMTDWFQGKCFDTFAPLGPWLVPSSCIDDPHNLHMKLAVNGEVMQDATTNAMIFDIREQIAYLSSILTLKPGDVLAIGTPTGVGMSRGIFLKPGDVMTASIESIGTLRNPVAALSHRR